MYSIFPFDSTRMTPKREKIIEKICSKLTFSFKKMTEQTAMEIIFNVDINPTFVAVVALMLKIAKG